MEVGELSIGASIDLGTLGESLKRMESQLDEVGGKFDSVNSDMTRAEGSARGLSLGFLSITAATAAIYGLAKTAPQLAGSLAEMEIAMMDVSFALGDALSPAFETAADGLSNFADWMRENEDLVGSLGEVINGTLILAIEGLSGAWAVLDSLGVPEGLEWLLDNFGAEAGGGILGWLLTKTPQGAAIGGAGAGILEGAGDPSDPFFGETLGLVLGGGALASGIGAPLAGLLGAGGYFVGEALEKFFTSLFNNSNQESQIINSSDNFI